MHAGHHERKIRKLSVPPHHKERGEQKRTACASASSQCPGIGSGPCAAYSVDLPSSGGDHRDLIGWKLVLSISGEEGHVHETKRHAIRRLTDLGSLIIPWKGIRSERGTRN